MFSKPQHARAPLRYILGEHLADTFDWSSLRLEPGTHVDERFRDSLSDLLFSVRRRDSAARTLAYLLWDHQSSPDTMMPLRLLCYGGRALHDYTERSDAVRGYVPPLIPVLLYQGSKAWPGPFQLSELHVRSGEPALPVFMDLRMIVHELGDDSLPAHDLTTLTRAALRLMRLAAMGRLDGNHAAVIAGWITAVHRAHGYAAFRVLMEYIARASKQEDIVDELIEHASEDMEEEFFSAADKLEARGSARTQREILVELLEQRFGSLPASADARIYAAEPGQVRGWILRLHDSKALDDVFAERP